MQTKHLIILLISIFVVSFSASAATDKKKADHIQTITFGVSMDCMNCKNKIEKNIAFEKGIKDMNVDLNKKQVTLTFDTRKTDEKKIIGAFEKLGYTAAPVPETEKPNNN